MVFFSLSIHTNFEHEEHAQKNKTQINLHKITDLMTQIVWMESWIYTQRQTNPTPLPKHVPPLAANPHSLFNSSLSTTQVVGFTMFNVGFGFNGLWVWWWWILAVVVGLWQWILVGFSVDCGSIVVWLDFVWISW